MRYGWHDRFVGADFVETVFAGAEGPRRHGKSVKSVLSCAA
jgi:hypothetical protein